MKYVSIAFVGLIFLNLLSMRESFRIDLTKDKRFTLSEASVKTVQNLKDTLTVSAYFSDDLPPPYSQHARYVHDLLEEYAANSGLFAFEFGDPKDLETPADRLKKKDVKQDVFGQLIRESTSVENELSELGLMPVEISIIEGDQQRQKKAYMGLVVRYQEKYETVPVVQNLADLEKDLTSLMKKLTRSREPKIGLLKDPQINIETLSRELRKNTNLELVESAQKIDHLDALVVVGSGNLLGTEGSIKILDFLNQGKNVALFLDRFIIDPQSFEVSAKAVMSLDALGLEFGDSLIADANCAFLDLQENTDNLYLPPIKYAFAPELFSLSFENSITKGLRGVVLPFVSPITVKDKLVNYEILAKSSNDSWLEKMPLDLSPERDWVEKDITLSGPHNLAINKKVGEKGQLLAVGSSAFVWDEFLSGPNLILAQNMVDYLVADPALLKIKSRQLDSSPIDSELSDAFKMLIKYGNMLGVPLLLIAYGLIRWRMREYHRNSLRRLFF